MSHSKGPFRILVVDDDPALLRLAHAALTGRGFTTITTAGTAAEAMRGAAEVDLLLLDVQLPDGSGLDVLRRLRERSARPAVVIVTGHGAEAVAAEALRLGADDYVSKDAGFLELLPSVVEHVRRTVALRDELEAAEREVVEAERRSAVGEMTVALHHEINNPLMAALTEAELLLEEPGLTPATARGLGVIRVALDRIRSAVKRAGEADGARNVDYLAGALKMIDLDGPRVIPGLLGRALIAAEDPPLRRVLSVLLRRPGFETEAFESLDELATRLTEEPAPAVVVLAGISRSDTDRSGITAPGALPHWALVTFPLPFDPAVVAEQVVQAVEARQRGD